MLPQVCALQEAPAYRMLTVAGFGNQDGDAANYDLR